MLQDGSEPWNVPRVARPTGPTGSWSRNANCAKTRFCKPESGARPSAVAVFGIRRALPPRGAPREWWLFFAEAILTVGKIRSKAWTGFSTPAVATEPWECSASTRVTG
eukprot:236049-Pyramimonas_sp.AAC.2